MDVVSLLNAAVLGIVEGATEFIPVSSTGHLIIVQDWLGFTGVKENAFVIFIQLGAIAAVVWLYRTRFLHVARNLNTDPRARGLVVNLVVGTIPAVVVGLPTEDWIEAHLFRPLPVSVALVLGGLAILLVERIHKQPHITSVDDLPLTTAMGVGMIQVLAILFPGVSRSGATIMGGLVLGLSRTAATEFSFFLAIPAMLGASVVKLWGIRGQFSISDLPIFGCGFVVAFLAALVAVQALLAYVSHRSFVPFAWYRILFGVVVLWIYGRHSGSF